MILNPVTWGQVKLFKFNFSASLFELLLEALGVSLRETFLNNARSAVNEFLSFLEAKTGELLNELNNGELAGTSALEYYVERGLLLGSSCTTGSGSGNSNSGSCGFDAILFLEDLSKFVYFFY